MKNEVQVVVSSYQSVWEERCCTIMADGWQDRSNRQLINFLVHCKRGTTFVRSIDTSDIVKDATTICKLFVELVEWVGSKNVIHLVIDNGANYKDAMFCFKISIPPSNIMDTDRRPSIGYVYNGMYMAKRAIKNIFKNKRNCKPYYKYY
ncbi:hypothetical protein F511_17231 [Dorcoceras hygrometricum]|uniref:DUF659 domain-containing protein n=1 Tax=Dorcoceras hygrometricum TaxID=472368 RepID=A0A2Z7AVD9_9LAMI|nr:hypothetical protein F511_17231 [Dorcoceras hygrometricum]